MNNSTVKILLVEDNPGDARLIQEMLAEEVPVPYRFTLAENLRRGLDAAAGEDSDVILLDLGLPESQGLDTLQRVRARFPAKPVVVLTGLDSRETGMEAVRQGAQDYLVKRGLEGGEVLWRSLLYAIERARSEERLRNSEDRLREAQKMGRIGCWDFDLASNRIEWSDEVFELYERDRSLGPPTPEEEAAYYPPEQAARLREMARQVAETGDELCFDLRARLPSGRTAFFNSCMHAVRDAAGSVVKVSGIVQDVTSRKRDEEELLATQAKLQQQLQGTIHVIQQMTEARDQYTSGHQKRVAQLAVAITRQMGLPEESCVQLVDMAALIHDIGKIAVPAEILAKPTTLLPAERSLVRTHAEMGYAILKEAGLPYPVPEIVLQHHERCDGSGYPKGLRGDEILPEASIIVVADVVEAMSSHRPYRPALGIEAALEEISHGSGVRYDPDVVAACLALFREKHFAFSD